MSRRDENRRRTVEADAWTAAWIIARYHEHAKRFRVRTRREFPAGLASRTDALSISPAIHAIIVGIREGDAACAQIGIELIEQDGGFPFGACLKSNAARALRGCPRLTDGQIAQIRRRVVNLYRTGTVPREFREYARLLRKIGFANTWQTVRDVKPLNRYAQHSRAYFLRHCDPALETRTNG